VKRREARMGRIEYEPISRGMSENNAEFRLLRLQKGNNYLVECEIFHAPLCDPGLRPKYNALSYTWGNPKKKAVIIVNGIRRKVRHNLGRALSALRREDEDMILWVDALCINQEDLEERGQQVRLMEEIYKNAEAVLIYLGRGNSKTSVAIDSIYKAGNLNQNKRDLKSKFTKEARMGLRDLIDRPWYDRVWILQEVAHARKALVYCGARSITTGAFTRALDVCDVEVGPHREAVFSLMPDTSFGSWSWYLTQRERTLKSLLKKFQRSKACDPRDKIYALLSISSNASKTEHIRPDYSKNKTLSEVIYDTNIFLIGYHSHTIPLRGFKNWNLDDLYRNIDRLPELALLWAVNANESNILMHVLQSYKPNTELAKQILDCAVDAGYLHVLTSLLDHYSSRNAGGEHDLPIYSFEKALKSEKLIAVRLVIQRYGTNMLNREMREKIELLVDKAGNINLSNFAPGGSPRIEEWASLGLRADILRQAIQLRREDMAEMFLKRWHYTDGISSNLFLDLLRWATRDSHHELRETLLSRWSTRLQFRPDLDEQHVHEILTLGAAVDLQTSQGETPLMKAVKDGPSRVVSLLIEKGANVNSRDNSDKTPLMFATENWSATRNEVETVRSLLEGKAEVNAKDKNGRTALSRALICSQRVMGIARINKRRSNHYAAEGNTKVEELENNIQIVALLLDHGADLTNREKLLLTTDPRDSKDLVKLLLQADCLDGSCRRGCPCPRT